MQVPVVTRTSQATRPVGSLAITASRTASEIWSAILSGCPSVTDSEVNMCRCVSAIPALLWGKPPGVWLFLCRQPQYYRRFSLADPSGKGQMTVGTRVLESLRPATVSIGYPAGYLSADIGRRRYH